MINDIRLKDIMIRHVATIDDTEKVTTAGKIMALKNIGSIIVSIDDKLLGILTEKDLLKKIVAKGLDPNNVLVKNVMTTGIKTATSDQNIFDAFNIMKKGKFRRLPVVDNGKLIGIVTETDVNEALHNYSQSINPQKEDLSSINKTHIQKILTETFNLESRKTYIITEEKPNLIYDMFLSMISEDYVGIAITRQNPENIKLEYGFEETMFLWLTTLPTENSIKPTDIEKLRFIIASFMNKTEKSIILLDGIEFMINYISFKETLQFLQTLIDKVSTSNSILLLSLDPETLEKKEFKLISRSAIIYKKE